MFNNVNGKQTKQHFEKQMQQWNHLMSPIKVCNTFRLLSTHQCLKKSVPFWVMCFARMVCKCCTMHCFAPIKYKASEQILNIFKVKFVLANNSNSHYSLIYLIWKNFLCIHDEVNRERWRMERMHKHQIEFRIHIHSDAYNIRNATWMNQLKKG